MFKSLKMVANRKDLEYFAKSLNVIQKDSVGKETFVEVYGEKKQESDQISLSVYHLPRNLYPSIISLNSFNNI